jgi:hypothetical protein
LGRRCGFKNVFGLDGTSKRSALECTEILQEWRKGNKPEELLKTFPSEKHEIWNHLHNVYWPGKVFRVFEKKGPQGGRRSGELNE